MKILLAGATGYLGGHIAETLMRRGHALRVVVRDANRLSPSVRAAAEVIEAEITRLMDIAECCAGVDAVISSVGITRQRDELSYFDVDYQANLNLLHEALRSGVQRFVYVSVLHGEQMQELKICAAKEQFVRRLKCSGLDYCVVRPNGFFSDMEAVVDMARRGRVGLFGNGELRANPIHGADLAEVCVDALAGDEHEIAVGGPEILTQNQIVEAAFAALGQPVRMAHLPACTADVCRWLLQRLAPESVHGPLEFLLTVMTRDMLAPPHGQRRLAAHFAELAGPGGATERSPESQH